MLSHTCKTAIKAVIYLSAKSCEGKKAGVKEIARMIGASEHTVGKSLQTLVRKNIINSTKGPNGGFYLDELQQNQPIYNIVETIEGEDIFKACGLGLSECSESHPCPLHDDYKVVRELIEKIFREKKISDLKEPVSSGLAFLKG